MTYLSTFRNRRTINTTKYFTMMQSTFFCELWENESCMFMPPITQSSPGLLFMSCGEVFLYLSYISAVPFVWLSHWNNISLREDIKIKKQQKEWNWYHLPYPYPSTERVKNKRMKFLYVWYLPSKSEKFANF